MSPTANTIFRVFLVVGLIGLVVLVTVLIAAIGLGVVLTYRGAGVVNFANAAVATTPDAAYARWTERVAVQTEKSVEAVMLYLGVLRAGDGQTLVMPAGRRTETIVVAKGEP